MPQVIRRKFAQFAWRRHHSIFARDRLYWLVYEKDDALVMTLKPCSRCEQELPPSAFSEPDSPFCAACTKEIVAIIRSKYNAIEAAHFRAKLRKRSRAALDELLQNKP